jgi:radical SAM superfamily enzyme YgiQ (UPF0313 family)
MAWVKDGVVPTVANPADRLAPAFGTLGIDDKARYLASLMLADIEELIRGLDPRFQLHSYGAELVNSGAVFEHLEKAVLTSGTLVDRHTDRLTSEHLERFQPDAVGVTIPFPGNVYGAFRIARQVRTSAPRIPIIMGGGFVNCKMRKLEEQRVFDYVDFISFDDGEQPMLSILEHLAGKRSRDQLLRTMVRENEKVVQKSDPATRDVPFKDTGTPSWVGLNTHHCIPTLPDLSPMARIWHGTRWNKLTAAHGCYWRQCTFCDISLDYVGRYEPATADLLVDRVQAVMAETGLSGFHLVDEAAPPSLLKAFAERLLERRITISWWGNIRFEKTFTPALSQLLAKSGCVAVTGGLEVASDRILALIKKGVTVAQVTRVARSFVDAGVMVHAYLMYGFPSQTEQEMVDSAEIVRQLFLNKCLHSGYWHRFFATAYSPIGMSPEYFGIELAPRRRAASTFVSYTVPFSDPDGCDSARFADGLATSAAQYMIGAGLERDVRTWFSPSDSQSFPGTTIASDFIARIITDNTPEPISHPPARLLPA